MANGIKCSKKLQMATTVTVCLLLFSVAGYVFIQSTCSNFKYHDEISTTRDTSYILYGDGLADKQTTERLHSYIRSVTSRQTPGGVHLTDTSGRRHFSQIGQSEFVDELLKGRRNGVFIECGAFDGETNSNSLFFELHRNWTGVLIEANPIYHQSVLSKNRNAYVVRACLSTASKPQTVRFKQARLLSGIATYNKLYNSGGYNSSPSVEVQCFPLNAITAALGIRHVDYFSLDVEGAEMDILSRIDWTQFSVDVMTVEYGWQTDILSRLRSLMTANRMFTQVSLIPVNSTTDSEGVDVVFVRSTK